MSIFKKIAGLFSFSAAAVTTPAPVVSAQEVEVLTELESGKCELTEKEAIEKALLAVLKEESEGAIRMRQAEKTLVATYRALSSCEDRLEIIEDSIQQAKEDRESAALSALDMARKLKQERMDKKMAKLGGAPKPRFIPQAPTPTPTPTPTSVVTGTIPTVAPVAPVVTGTLPRSFNVSQKQ